MKKHLCIGFFLVLFHSPGALFPQNQKELVESVAQDDLGNVSDAFQENFFEALKQKAIENHERAIEALEKCLAIDDTEPVVYLELGKNYNQLENYTKAATYLKMAREAAPENEAVLVELYRTYYHVQEFEKALPVVMELTELNATFSEDLANLYLLNEKYDQALELLDKLDEEWGESEYRNGLRRQIYARTDDVAGKIADLEKRIKNDPSNEQNYLNLIFVYSEEGKSEKAFETAKELERANPSSELVHLALYKFYLEEGSSEEAVESMKILLKGRELDSETKYKVLNDFLLFAGQEPGMEDDLKEVVEVFSEGEGNTEVYEQLGNFFLERNQLRKAMEYFEQGLERDQENFPLIIKALLLQLEFRKFEEAVIMSQEGIENFPSQPLLYLLNGTALNHLQKYGEAEVVLTTGLDYLLDDAEMEAGFYEQLSIAYAGLNNEKRAAEYQEKAAQSKTETIDE